MEETYYLFNTPVIPAKAGIQIIDETPRSGTKHPKLSFVRNAELYGKLDSGLRRNDEI